MLHITSTNNAKVKFIGQLLKKSSLRKKEQLFVIEGKRELYLALQNGYHIKSVFFEAGIFPLSELEKWKKTHQSDFEIIQLSNQVYKKLAYRDSTEGILALAQMKSHRLADIKIDKNPFFLVAESIEKPGNLGAILRSVDGAGANGLLLVNPVADLYNPNVIRASLGTLFSNQIALTQTDELQDFLQQHQIDLYAATLQNAHKYYLEDFTGPTAIAVGAEDRGLTKGIRNISRQSVYIPMRGQADSLNVSVSAALLLYEIVKQRKL